MESTAMRAVSVLGAGTMGHGIAQCFAMRGYRVRIFDTDPDTLKSAPERIRRSLEVFRELEFINATQAGESLANVVLCRGLADMAEGAELIIEAVTEELAVKRRVFGELERLVPPETVLCSNTSAILISEISAGLTHPGRVLGTHFWNPAAVLPCVEVIRSPRTEERVFEQVIELMRSIGKEPVRVLREVPGFVGNRMQHALQREAVSLVENGVASAEDVDRVVRYSFGLRLALMGPLERADQGGLDVTTQVQRYLLPHLETRTTPAPLLEELVSRGDLGLKTGQGFYTWSPERIAQTLKTRDRLLLSLIRLTAREPG